MKTVPIKDFEKYTISENGTVKNIRTGHILSPGVNSGYKRINLSKKGRCYTFKHHRLLAIAFIPNPENKPCINHIDGNKLNNSLDNLEWCTYSENQVHAFSIGLQTINEKQRLLASEHGKMARKLIVDTSTGIFYESMTEACECFGYSSGYMSRMLRGLATNRTSLQYV